MRPRRKVPSRTGGTKKAAAAPAPGGSQSWMRLLLLFVAAALLFWAVAFRSEKLSFSALGIGGGGKALSAEMIQGEDSSSDAAQEASTTEGVKSTVAAGTAGDGGVGSSGNAAADADADGGKSVAITPPGENDTGSADSGELADATTATVLEEKKKEQDEVKAAAEAAAGTDSTTATTAASAAAAEAAAAARRRRRRRRGPNAHYKPENGSFVVTWARPKKRFLNVNIDRTRLTRVYLDATRFAIEDVPGADPENPPVDVTRGSGCPDFEYGYENYKGIASCWHEPIEDIDRLPSKFPANCPRMEKTCTNETDQLPHEKWSAQVLLLHNVYINVAGQVFNRTHYFDHNGCAADQGFKFAAGKTRVIKYKELVSLIDWYGWNSRTVLLDTLPQIVSLETVLPKMKGMPVAFGHRLTHQRNQMEQMIGLGFNELLGLRLERFAPQILSGDDLFYADKLFLPLHQRCGRPSRAMWQYIRTRHFLPRAGVPMYRHGSDMIPSFRKAFLRENVQPGADWVALIGVKDEGGRKPLVESIKVYNHLLKYLPASKVKFYKEGTLSFPDRKQLLNKARFLVSTHENLLADMVFMPPGGVVLELRPVLEPDPTFHHLAEVCGLQYHLMFVEGRKGGRGRLKVIGGDPVPIHKQLRVIAKRLMKGI